MKTFNRSKSLNQRALGVSTQRSLSFGSPRVNRSSSVSQWFCVLVMIGSLLSFFVVIGGGYIFVLPSLSQGFGSSKSNGTVEVEYCDMFDGRWIVDDNYPLYNASECPFAEQGFNCLGNGRRDKEYLKWRWKPKNCEIPRFNVQYILEKLRNKRVVFVGDSMSRTQWESLICLLMTGVDDKRTVYEVNGNKITKRIRFLGVQFSSFNITIEFFRSVFLVQHGWIPRHSPKRVRSTLRLDRLDDISYKWINSDVLIFNSGQWWVPGKLFETGCYFQVGNAVKLGMSIPTAFGIAMDTWASWVENMIAINRTRVFFRTFEPSHWRLCFLLATLLNTAIILCLSDRSHRLCNVTQQPLSEISWRGRSIFTDTILQVTKNMTAPVTVLRITPMSAFRSDAHVGEWNYNLPIADCSHWCLPGVPDIWNEIFLSLLFY